MKNILIIGCGLLGSSLLRRIHKKKVANKIFIYEKSNSNISKIKKLKLPGIIIKDLDQAVKNSDLIILCTPMSEYKNLIVKMNKSLSDKNIITDIGSSKIESSKIIKKFLKKFPKTNPKKQVGVSSYYKKRYPKDNKLNINHSIKKNFNLLRIGNNELFPSYFKINNQEYIKKKLQTKFLFMKSLIQIYLK